ncbi:hypothetical protein TH5_21040 [Thalassospira xianhensis MCCC 1A02616]|uniref:Uncharacterized protein n=1 Tax=Thalassospira xianhensis MCCC 1A02616 TaxID=1177929 RepID=A0A367U7U8_9PROT|nr:hypothetical protein TH5_21040 [Thalassospira xianhensis MCCC 1A02616]
MRLLAFVLQYQLPVARKLLRTRKKVKPFHARHKAALHCISFMPLNSMPSLTGQTYNGEMMLFPIPDPLYGSKAPIKDL